MTDDKQNFDHADKRKADLKGLISCTMIIRTWLEPDHPHGFRARITSGLSSDGEEKTVVTADPDKVLMAVQEWLASQLGASSSY